MVSKHKTGYMAGFSVYTGQVANELLTKMQSHQKNVQQLLKP